MQINGSKGRIEMRVVEKSYVNSGGLKEDEGALNEQEHQRNSNVRGSL